MVLASRGLHDAMQTIVIDFRIGSRYFSLFFFCFHGISIPFCSDIAISVELLWF